MTIHIEKDHYCLQIWTVFATFYDFHSNFKISIRAFLLECHRYNLLHISLMISIKQCQITMPTKPCIGPAASLYRERFDLPRHHAMGIRSLVPPLIGPPSHWSPSHWSPNSLVPQYIIGAHWSPISLVPHIIGPPSHWSPFSLVTPSSANPNGPPSYWSPISLVPHLISPPTHQSSISLVPN